MVHVLVDICFSQAQLPLLASTEASRDFHHTAPHMSIDDKVASLAPWINDSIEKFEQSNEGVQPFQEKLLAAIKEGGLSDERWIDTFKVGVHPDNRDKCGLVPVDVHELLAIIVAAGWSWRECDGALACEIPPNALGISWRAFNDALAKKSDGYLADCASDHLEAVSARGSHTTAGVRCVQFGSKGIHDDLCTDGRISRSKIIERQPSMREPLDKGMKYIVIRWQLAEACPRLMEILSVTGNASHGAARLQTALQGCRRVFTLATNMNAELPDYWDNVARAAAIGMPPGYLETSRAYCAFVKRWAGGKDGHVLDELVAYERILSFKRTISPSDMKAMAEVRLWECPRYVPAMVKALLLAPPNFVQEGVAKMFSASDYASLNSNGSKIRKLAHEAHTTMNACHSFFGAYAVLDETEMIKITSELEVRCVMLAHGKKSATRSALNSFVHIANDAYERAATAMRAADRTLPKWEFISQEQAKASETKENNTDYIREFDTEGTIADVDMRARNFVNDALIVPKESKDKDRNEETPLPSYVIVDVSGQEVILKQMNGDGVADEDVTLHRAVLLSKYKIKVPEQIDRLRPGEYVDPSSSKEFIMDIAKGVIKSVLKSMFASSSEQHVEHVKKSSKVHVVTSKDFNKEEQLKLIPLTSSIIIGKNGPASGHRVCFGSMGSFGLTDDKAFAKGSITWPNPAQTNAPCFIAAFWNVESVNDSAEANCAIMNKDVSVSIMKTTYSINVPFMTNTKPIKKDTELKVYIAKESDDDHSEPDVPPRPAKKAKGGSKGASRPGINARQGKAGGR